MKPKQGKRDSEFTILIYEMLEPCNEGVLWTDAFIVEISLN